MENPLYDPDFDAAPLPFRQHVPGKKHDPWKSSDKSSAGDRLAGHCRTDTIGLGLYFGYLGSLLLVTVVGPSVTGEALWVGLAALLGMPVCWAMRRAYAVTSPYITSRQTRLLTIVFLSVASPLLIAMPLLFHALHAERPFLRAEVGHIIMLSMAAQFGLLCFVSGKMPEVFEGSGKPARARPTNAEIKAVKEEWAELIIASIMGLFASFLMLGVFPGTKVHDVRALADVAHMVVLLRPVTAFWVFKAFVAGVVAGYGIAFWMVFRLSQAGCKRLGA